MRKAIKLSGFTLFLIFVLYSISFAEEKLTITTYYPSPNGVYKELTTTGKTRLANTKGTTGASGYDSFVTIGEVDETDDGDQRLNGESSFTCCPVGCTDVDGWFNLLDNCTTYSMKGDMKGLVKADDNDILALQIIKTDEDSPIIDGRRSAFASLTGGMVPDMNFQWWFWPITIGKAYTGGYGVAVGDPTLQGSFGIGLLGQAANAKLNRGVWGTASGDSTQVGYYANAGVAGEAVYSNDGVGVIGGAISRNIGGVMKGLNVRGVAGYVSDDDPYSWLQQTNPDIKVAIDGVVQSGNNDNDIAVRGTVKGTSVQGGWFEANQRQSPLDVSRDNIGVYAKAEGAEAKGVKVEVLSNRAGKNNVYGIDSMARMTNASDGNVFGISSNVENDSSGVASNPNTAHGLYSQVIAHNGRSKVYGLTALANAQGNDADSSAYGVKAVAIHSSNTAESVGIWGEGYTEGVRGIANYSNGIGVKGEVYPGLNDTMTGVYGHVKGNSASFIQYPHVGVFGDADGQKSIAVKGLLSTTSTGGMAGYFFVPTVIANDPDTYAGYFNGNMWINGAITWRGGYTGAGSQSITRDPTTGYLYISSSSIRYKNDVCDYNIDYIKLLKLRPVRFKWNEKTATPGVEDFGLIAEEVDKVIPDLVIRGKDNQIESVKYDKLGIVLLVGLKAQEERISVLEKEVEALKKEISSLKK